MKYGTIVAAVCTEKFCKKMIVGPMSITYQGLSAMGSVMLKCLWLCIRNLKKELCFKQKPIHNYSEKYKWDDESISFNGFIFAIVSATFQLVFPLTSRIWEQKTYIVQGDIKFA